MEAMRMQLSLFHSEAESENEEHQPETKQHAAPCELCGVEHSWYESVLARHRPEIRDLYRRTCGLCRGRYTGAIKTHHLDTTWAMRLITALRCEICDNPLPVDYRGRRQGVVDHNHACCPADASCGHCVRGILCRRCNHVIGVLETSLREIDFDRFLGYIKGVF